jgi:hypothetical protein
VLFRSTNDAITPYVRYGDLTARIAIVIAALIIGMAVGNKLTEKKMRA